jgi:outer membrane protein OmpA-like peptidoglycan-associated protein
MFSKNRNLTEMFFHSKTVLIIAVTLALFVNTMKGQQNLTLYNMEMVPQRMYMNPALVHSNKLYIGLPVISSTYFNVSNSGFKYSDLIRHNGDSLYVDFDNMLGKLAENNYISTAVNIDILSFGFRIKKNYFSFNATEKINVRFRYPKNFMEFAWKGNGALLGEEVNFNFGINAIHYREYGLGYAREINDKLTVGGKLKYLYGMENVWTEESDVSLTTDPNSFAITAKSNVKINVSGIDSVGKGSMSDYLFKKKNNGFGVDLGGVYKLDEKLTFSASIIDLGFIRWKDNVSNYQSSNTDASYTYEGVDLNQLLNDTSENKFGALLDSVVNTFKLDTVHTTYSTRLSTQVYMGGNYNFTKKINVGALLYGQVFDKSIHPGLALSYNQRVGNWFGFSLSYSMYNRSYNNAGLGLSFGNGPTQFYIVSDNLLGAIFPQNTKNLHLNFGFNLIFGKARKKKDTSDVKEDNTDVSESKKTKKISDKDNETTLDGKGSKKKNKDESIDKKTENNDVEGSKKSKSSVDTDGDGVDDKDDLCIDVAGLAGLKGCPDKDGDGIADKDDACVDKAGSAANKGCPELKLLLIDINGTVLASSTRNSNGVFTFDGVTFDENTLFRLDGEKPDSMPELKISVAGETWTASRTGMDYPYKYHFLASEVNKFKKVSTGEVFVKLDKKEEEVLKKAFNNLEFATGKDIIKETSFSSLDELANLMSKKPTWKLKISGHTDNKGDAVANLKLSEKRAEAIKKYLVSKGIAADRFKVEWFGSAKPIADNATEAGRQQNRRVEMAIFE